MTEPASPTPQSADPTPATAPASPPPGRRSGWLADGRGTGAALAVAAVALVLAAAPWLGGAGFVRQYLIANPEVLDQAVAARQDREDAARADQINAAAAANPALLRVDARDPAFGPAEARVTVTEFFDFRCPGCKVVAPEVLALIRANPDVRFVFKDWPILDRGDDATSQYAARAALAAHQQGRYLQVYQALMAAPALTPEGVDQVLVQAGVDLDRARVAMTSPEVSRHIADIQTTAAVLGLTGTPTFFVNGRATPTIAPDDVAAAIAAARG